MNDIYTTLKTKALRALARRDHSRQELTQKLSRFCEDVGLIKQIINECEKNNWLNELRFAKIYVKSRAERHYGPKKIRYELQQRGLNEALIEEAIAIPELDWKERAEIARKKKFGSAAATSWSERAKQSQYLYQRGF